MIDYKNIEPGNENQLRAALSEGLDAVVAGHEDTVYIRPGGLCWYRRNGEPSCLWGHVLDALGVPPEMIQENVGISINLHNIFALPVLSEVAYAAKRSQEAQDGAARSSKSTWGQAREEFYQALRQADDDR